MAPKELVVVDDNQDTCVLLEALFNENTNTTITSYSDVDKFLHDYKAHPVSLVLLDYNLGEHLASDVVKRIEEINPDATIIIMSASLEKDGELALSKPFHDVKELPNEIMKRVIKYQDDTLTRNCIIDAILEFLRIKVNQCPQNVTAI